MSPARGRESEAAIDRLAALFDDNVDAMFNVAYRIVWNRADANDVVQSSFIKAMRALDQLRAPDRARSWLLRITYREALQLLRGRRELPLDPGLVPERIDPGGSVEAAVIGRELAQTIRIAIDRLPPTLRLAFVLRDVEEVPMAEVAEILGIGASAAKMRVSRARERLRTDLIGRI